MNIGTTVSQNLREPRRLYDVDEPDAERCGEDEAIATRPSDETEDSDAGYGDGGVEEDLHAAEDGGWLENHHY